MLDVQLFVLMFPIFCRKNVHIIKYFPKPLRYRFESFLNKTSIIPMSVFSYLNLKNYYNLDFILLILWTRSERDKALWSPWLVLSCRSLSSMFWNVSSYHIFTNMYYLSGFIFKKLYKILSEVKLEVETVIKTGRHIVQKQQTDNPKGMDEQLTSLKVLYNDLGAQVSRAGVLPPLSLSFMYSKILLLGEECLFEFYGINHTCFHLFQ